MLATLSEHGVELIPKSIRAPVNATTTSTIMSRSNDAQMVEFVDMDVLERMGEHHAECHGHQEEV